MYRTVLITILTLGAIALPVETSLAFNQGSGAGKVMARVVPAYSHVPPQFGGGAALSVSAQPTRPGPGHPLPRPGRPIPRPHICLRGTSWQYGCVAWAPAGPGQLFGACLRSAWSCKRVAGPVQ